MKKLLIALILLIPTFLNTQAKTKQENIKVLFQLMKTDSVVDKTIKSMLPMLLSTKVPQDVASSARMDSVTTKITNIMFVITNRLMNEDMVQMYDKYYTEKEINDLIVFYKSPTGQKTLTVSPELSKEMMMVLMTKYFPEIKRMVKE